MTTTFTVPNEYGYVLFATAAACFNSLWHGARVSGFRKRAGVPYPIPYALPNTDDYRAPSTDAKAKEKYLFNCAQRAHGNFLEAFPAFVPSLLIAGLKYPVAAAIMGGIWNVGRIAYAIGYTRPDKTKGEGRLAGGLIATLQLIGLWGMSVKVAYDVFSS